MKNVFYVSEEVNLYIFDDRGARYKDCLLRIDVTLTGEKFLEKKERGEQG